MLTEDEKLESYGKLYISMLRKVLLEEDEIICINLLSDKNYYPDLFIDLKNNFLNNEGILIEVKNKVLNMNIKTIDLTCEDMVYLTSFLEDTIELYTNNGKTSLSFSIFGTSHIDNATFEFHKLIKKHNDCIIKIVHS